MHFNKDYKDLKKFSEKILVTGLPKKNFYTNLNYDITNNNTNFKFLVFAGSQGSLDILTVFKKIIYELNKMPNLKKRN